MTTCTYAPYGHICPDCGHEVDRWCSECAACKDCCPCGTLFDADELGIDPEVDAERFERA